MTKLWATIIETTTRDVQLEAPDNMTLDELKDLAAEGELLDSCEVIDETPEEDNEETTMYIYNFDGKPVENEEDNNYDAGHAEEWMEKHPHGYYNSENDYGEDADDDDEEE